MPKTTQADGAGPLDLSHPTDGADWGISFYLRIRSLPSFTGTDYEISTVVSHRNPTQATAHGFVMYALQESATSIRLNMHVKHAGGTSGSYTAARQTSELINKWVFVKFETRQFQSTQGRCYLTLGDQIAGYFSCDGILGPTYVAGSKLTFGDVPNMNTMITGVTLKQNPMDFEIDKVLLYRGSRLTPIFDEAYKPNC
jgi:hypothetical protein